MAEQIQIKFSEQEQMIQHALHVLEEANALITSMSAIISAYSSLSSHGSFKDIYLGVDGKQAGNNGFSHFALKAQDLAFLAEVLYTHVEQTYSKMVDMDKLIAVRIANDYYLNNPEVHDELKTYIRQNPEAAVAEIKANYIMAQSQEEARA